MRLLLTSAGLTNDTLVGALADLLVTPFEEARVVVLLTASLADAGDHRWLLDELNRLAALGWNEIDLLDFSGLPPEVVLHRLQRADVIYATGGNHYHLALSIERSGLVDDLRALLGKTVWLGQSAGSMIFSGNLTRHAAELIGDVADLTMLGVSQSASPFALFDWYVKPHLGSPEFPERDDDWAQRLGASVDFPLFVIDDDTAIRVTGERGDSVDVITSGRYLYFDPAGGR